MKWETNNRKSQSNRAKKRSGSLALELRIHILNLPPFSFFCSQVQEFIAEGRFAVGMEQKEGGGGRRRRKGPPPCIINDTGIFPPGQGRVEIQRRVAFPNSEHMAREREDFGDCKNRAKKKKLEKIPPMSRGTDRQ